MASRWLPRIATAGSGGGPTPPGSQDYFAPKYLVGNTANGDSATAYNTDGFRYFPDTGNGAGILAAVAAADPGAGGVRGDIWIRPGTYTMSNNIVVPDDVEIRGSGTNTTVIQSANGNVNGALIKLGNGSKLRSMYVQHDQPGSKNVGAEGDGVIQAKNAVGALCEDVNVSSSWANPANNALRGCFYAFGSGGEVASLTLVRCAAAYKNNTGGSYLDNLVGFRGRDANLTLVDCTSNNIGDNVNGYSIIMLSSEAPNSISVRGGLFTAYYGSIYIEGLQVGSRALFSDVVVRSGFSGTAGPVGIGAAGAWDTGIHNCDINMAFGTAKPCVGFYPTALNELYNTGRVIGCKLTGAATNYPWYSGDGSPGVSGYHTFIGNTYGSAMAAPLTGANDEAAHNIAVP